MYTGGIKVKLTKEKIKEAMEAGKKEQTFQEFVKPYRFGSPTPYREYGHVLTKLCELAMFTVRSARNHEAPHPAVIHNILDSSTLGISISTYGNSKGFSKDYLVALKQGEKIIKPINIQRGEEDLQFPPESNYPKMQSTILAEFPYSELNLKTKTIITVEKDWGESHYEVDFSRLK